MVIAFPVFRRVKSGRRDGGQILKSYRLISLLGFGVFHDEPFPGTATGRTQSPCPLPSSSASPSGMIRLQKLAFVYIIYPLFPYFPPKWLKSAIIKYPACGMIGLKPAASNHLANSARLGTKSRMMPDFR